MNVVDYILIGIVLLYALFGFVSGLLTQICGLLSIIFSLSVGYLFYEWTGNLLFSSLILIAALIGFRILIHIIKRIYFGLRKKRPKLSFNSRILGGLIGSFKGGACASMALIFVYLFSGILGKVAPAITEHLEKSLFYSHLRQLKLLSSVGTFKNIYFASKLLGEDLDIKLSDNYPVLDELRNNPSFRAILEDEELLQSIQDKDYKKVLSHPKFLNLLNDKDFLRIISSIDYETIYEEQKESQE
jgi:uncharacterized membrane protein required for colicin V production